MDSMEEFYGLNRLKFIKRGMLIAWKCHQRRSRTFALVFNEFEPLWVNFNVRSLDL